ncbi:MAG: hypothetical protein AMJ89_05150 [candidate division Zixibacteria bacterium SM23_73]|nr:MAG: hypothetical protein AMJ89_05150 [candidate division Zixibacteria bacterium SM23_73]
MRQKTLIFASILSFTLLLFLCSLSFATKSRLSGMGDLSIVIEDESNMINLWDFARNPAGLLNDESGSVIRGNFLYSTEKPRVFSLIDYPYPYGFFLVEKADILNNGISVVFRKRDDFALGFEADYSVRSIEDILHEFEIKTSKFSLSLSKNLAPKAHLGLSLEYSEYENSFDNNNAEDFSAKIGLANELSDLIQIGGALAYEKFNPSADFYDLTDLRSLELTLQSFLHIQEQLKMGIETVLAYKKMGFGWSEYYDWARGERNEYYSTFLKLRGIYEFSPSFSVGAYYNDNDLFVSFFDPFYDFFRFPDYDFMIRHLGVGGVYKLRKKAVIGIEYHFKDTARERSIFQNHRLKKESINLGLEILPRKCIAFRGGYIRKEIREIPIHDESRKGWRNILTFGVGYESSTLGLSLDLVYRYTWGTVEIWEYYSRYSPGESERDILAISVKKLW